MYLNKDFKLIKRNNYIIWTAIGILFAIFIALFIVTSWYKYDLAITREFNKAMKFDFFKGWTGYFILDTYILVISVLVAMAYILLESLYKYLEHKHTNSLAARNGHSIKWFYVVGMIVEPIVTWLYLASYCFNDYGFGVGFIYWFIIDWKFIIPIYIVSGLINMAIFYSLLYYVHCDLAKREDFISSGTWQKAVITFIFCLFAYVPILVMKSGFGRPYLWNIEWHDYLNKIKDFSPERYNNYMNQDSVNLGWITHNGPIDQNFKDTYWPWWKVAKGYFNRGTSYYKNLPTGDAFPSGHMAATSIIIVALCYTMFGNAKSRKDSIIKWTVLGVCAVYALNLFFSLEISENHWTSDMSFTLMWAPIAFLISYGIDRGITKLVVDVNNKQA